MSKKQSTQEPWEQPIYETEAGENSSRSEQHRQKRGNSAFLTIVLILLFLIIAIPTIAGFWVMNRGNEPEPEAATEQTSTVATSSTASTDAAEVAVAESSSSEAEVIVSSESLPTDSSDAVAVEPASSAPAVEIPASSEELVGQSEPAEETTQNQGGEGVVVVQENDGPQQIADRAGISVEELFRLNGMSADDYMFHPGDQLKTR